MEDYRKNVIPENMREVDFDTDIKPIVYTRKRAEEIAKEASDFFAKIFDDKSEEIKYQDNIKPTEPGEYYILFDNGYEAFLGVYERHASLDLYEGGDSTKQTSFEFIEFNACSIGDTLKFRIVADSLIRKSYDVLETTGAITSIELVGG